MKSILGSSGSSKGKKTKYLDDQGKGDDEHENKSVSENLDTVTEEDHVLNESPCKKPKRFHRPRHSPEQIQALEAIFKRCPHPDEQQKIVIGRQVSLEPLQIKFWFQNRRSQLKAQIEEYENTLLREENEKLSIERITIRNVQANPICSHCGGPLKFKEPSIEELHVRIENARLRDELRRVRALSANFLGRPVSTSANTINPPPPNPSSNLEIGGSGVGNSSDFVDGAPSLSESHVVNHQSPLLDLAMNAMEELIKMVQMGEPLWVTDIDNGKETLNYDAYMQIFPQCIGIKPAEFVYEATRYTGMLVISGVELVEILMDAKRWADMFPSMIARVTTIDVISGGTVGTRDGALHLMNADLQILSPLVPTREVSFFRYSKQLEEGVWAIVDVSINGEFQSNIKCRRLPSGVLVRDMPDGYSKVTWVEHTEYDESEVHELFRPMLRSGMGLGSQCWVSILQRSCEGLILSPSSSFPFENADGRRNMVKLAQRLVDSFCAGMHESSSCKWTRFVGNANVIKDLMVMSKYNVNVVGEPAGIVVSAATSVLLQVSPQRLFDLLKDMSSRSKWDILCNEQPVKEIIHLGKGQDQGNAVSLLHAQIEEYENTLLREENEKLSIERITIRNEQANPICSNCGGPLKLKEPSIEELHVRIENTRLRDELHRVRALSAKFLGRPVSTSANTTNPPPPNPSSKLEIGGSGVGNSSDFVDVAPSLSESHVVNHQYPLLDLAMNAMEELIKMVQMREPLWVKDIDIGKRDVEL